jgi:thiosulfate dehydrogenase
MKMKKVLVTLCFMVSIGVFAASAAVSSATADEIEQLNGEEYELLTWGGLLYDNWYKVLNVKINETHPSYPPQGRKKGASTWRCKECHGWDYEGKNGAYSKGSHFTGIKGIRDYANSSPEEIIPVLKNDTHAFGSMIPERAYKGLAMFVAYGQVEMNEYLDRSTREAKGDVETGSRIYINTCLRCHGRDGKKINFKTPEKPEYLGTLANKNPWETLHKIRYGQPSENMISLLFLDIKEQVNVLSYCQTLPLM